MLYKLLIIIVSIAILCYCIIKIVECYYNIKTLKNAENNPGLALQNRGIAYDWSNNELEDDQSFLKPF